METVNTNINLTKRDSNLLAHGRCAITFYVSQRGLLLVNCLVIPSHSLRLWR